MWLDLAAGARARLAVWDGSTLCAPLVIARKTQDRATLRALKTYRGADLLQDWTAVTA